MPNRDYVVVSRYFDGQWRENVRRYVETTLEYAWREASKIAHELDAKYGSDHFWTVDVQNPEGSGYVQLFHGRLI